MYTIFKYKALIWIIKIVAVWMMTLFYTFYQQKDI